MKILGIGHASRVGKTTAANFIRDWVNHETHLLASVLPIASGIKVEAHRMFGRYGLGDEAHYEACPAEERTKVLPQLGKTPVELWVALGNFARSIDAQYWLKYLRRSLPAQPVEDFLIIPDIRLHPEANWVKAQGGLLLKVVRGGIGAQPGAALDQYLSNSLVWDAVLMNHDGMDDFRRDACRLFRWMFRANLPRSVMRDTNGGAE